MAKKQRDEITSQQVIEECKRGKFAPVYFFYGEEDFLIDESVDRLVACAIDDATRSFNVDILSGNETDATTVVSLAMSFPMMAERRVVIIREFDKLSNKDPLLSYLERPSPSTILTVICAKPDFRMKAYQVLREQAIVVEFRQLYDTEVPQWVSRRVELRGKSISFQACELIYQHVGRSLRDIQNEIDKLFMYVGGRQSIDLDDVEAVVGISKQYNIFELQQAIGSRNIGRALDILVHMLTAGESPVGIIVMLSRFFERLFLLKDAHSRKMPKQDMLALVKFSPKQVRFLENELSVAQQFSIEELEHSFSRLLEADEKLKTSDGEPKLVMTLLLYGLMNRQQDSHVLA